MFIGPSRLVKLRFLARGHSDWSGEDFIFFRLAAVNVFEFLDELGGKLCCGDGGLILLRWFVSRYSLPAWCYGYVITARFSGYIEPI